MKVGNKLHAIILSVVGIGAILALVIQMKAKLSAHQVQSPLKTTSKESVLPLVAASLPHVVYGDPFTHPKLPRQKPEKPADKGTEVTIASTPANPKGGQFAVPDPISGDLGYGPLSVDVSGKPPSMASKATVKMPSLGLQAIVSAPKPVAFISVDGKGSMEFGVGDSVGSHVVVTQIREDEIVVRAFNRPFTIRVGGKVQL